MNNLIKKNLKRIHPVFKQGYIKDLKKCKHGDKIKYRSSYEETFIEYLESNDKCIYYLYEKLKIPYRFYGKDRKYIPDFIVKLKDKFYIIEIKPECQVNDRKNKAKFAAAIKYASEHRNLEFKIITEKFLNIYRKNKQNLLND